MWKCKEWCYIQLTLGIWCGPLHNRNNRYARGRHATPTTQNARIYSTVKDCSIWETRVIEEIGQFPDSFVKTKNILTWFKKKRGIKYEKLGGFIAEYSFRFFYKENDNTTFDCFTKKMMAYLYEQDSWLHCPKFMKMFSRVSESWFFDVSALRE